MKTIKDLIVSASPIRIHNYLGKIVVAYADKDEEKCAPIFEMLEREQFVFCKNPIPCSDSVDPHYIENTREIIADCACFVIVVSDNLFAEGGSMAENILWYQIGLVEARNAGTSGAQGGGRTADSPILLPVRLENSKASLAGSPIQDLNVAADPEEMIRSLGSDRFSSRIIKGSFYGGAAMRFAGSRISYGSIKVSFDVTEKSFRNVKDLIRESQQNEIPDNELDALIRKSLIGKVRLISFGSRERMEPQFRIYEGEIDTKVENFPDNFVCAKSYLVKKPDEIKHTGIRAVLTVEFIVPVHTLLGVYFKPYITLASDHSDGYFSFGEEEMLELLRPTFSSSRSDKWYENTEFDTCYDAENKRLYFNLNNDKYKRLRLPPEMCLGEYADYMYPQ